jgi:membrane protease YdiL (CAAX protease family)
MSQQVVDALSYAVPVVGSLVGISLMLLLGVFRRQTGGGLREAPLREAGPGGISMLWVLGALIVYVVMINVFVAVLRAIHLVNLDAKSMSASDMVTLQGADAVLKLFLWITLASVLSLLMVGGLKGWGLGISQVWQGIKAGILGIAMLYPVLWLLNVLVEWVLSLFHRSIVEHETFDLLKQGVAVWQTVILFVAAAVVAPLFEELFFRGILQTALVQDGWGFAVGWRRRPVRGFEVEGVESHGTGGLPLYRPSTAQRWWAIVITAFLFAGVHGSLTNFPVLFVLGLGLGYVYERTGILWASVAMHAMFNTINLTGFFMGAT